jgi:hypothetical protein
MKLVLTLLLAGLLLLPGQLPAQAAPRVGEAQVRADANGQPCFTISEREEKRNGTPDFQAVTVSDGQRVLWHMAMPRERTFPLTAAMCIPYGGRRSALPQAPALALKEGKVYSVQVDVVPDRQAVRPSRYRTQFCTMDGGNSVAPSPARRARTTWAQGHQACDTGTR